ncbi:hypothetical protein ABZ817_24025 [Streptomyces antimycoticus]|uniref:hypothetical protein n=1 Tax=Streptomyces antimycoticus TaxID=68175 RepID=UPI0033E11AF4
MRGMRGAVMRGMHGTVMRGTVDAQHARPDHQARSSRRGTVVTGTTARPTGM